MSFKLKDRPFQGGVVTDSTLIQVGSVLADVASGRGFPQMYFYMAPETQVSAITAALQLQTDPSSGYASPPRQIIRTRFLARRFGYNISVVNESKALLKTEPIILCLTPASPTELLLGDTD